MILDAPGAAGRLEPPAFSFFSPLEVRFGRGRLAELGRLAAQWGGRCLLVTGRASLAAAGRLADVEESLRAAGLGWVRWEVAGEPDVETVDAGAELARRERCDMVVAVGGGSALDAGKAMAAVAANGGSALDYMEVVGAGRPLVRPGLPVVAVPTTAGTGAEATRNAVLGHRPSRRKASLRSPHLLPRAALVDPSLTDSLPPALTAASGLDSLTQLIEAYLSRGANPFSDALALDGVRRAAAALPRVHRDPGDVAARDAMALAALESGLALTSGGLGAVHGISGPLGGAFPVPHGFACAALLPHVFAANARHLLAGALGPSETGRGAGDREAGEGAVRRLATVAAALLGEALPPLVAADPRATADLVERAAARLRSLCREMGVPGLASYGVTRRDLPEIARQARRSSSTRFNPVELTEEELEELLAAAL